MTIPAGTLSFSAAEARVAAAALDMSAAMHDAAGQEHVSEIVRDLRLRFVALAQELADG